MFQSDKKITNFCVDSSLGQKKCTVLQDKGFDIENKPTAKVSDPMYQELVKEFQKSIAIKEMADQLVIGTRPAAKKESETVKLEDKAPSVSKPMGGSTILKPSFASKPAETKAPDPTPVAPTPAPDPAPAPPVADVAPKAEPVAEQPTEEPRRTPGLKVLGRIDLSPKGMPQKSVTPPPAPKPVSPSHCPVRPKRATPKAPRQCKYIESTLDNEQ